MHRATDTLNTRCLEVHVLSALKAEERGDTVGGPHGGDGGGGGGGGALAGACAAAAEAALFRKKRSRGVPRVSLALTALGACW